LPWDFFQLIRKFVRRLQATGPLSGLVRRHRIDRSQSAATCNGFSTGIAAIVVPFGFATIPLEWCAGCER